jgi:hypothetical protein
MLGWRHKALEDCLGRLQKQDPPYCLGKFAEMEKQILSKSKEN